MIIDFEKEFFSQEEILYVKKGNDKIYIEDLNTTLNDLFKYKNIQLNALIIYLERKTWTRLLKSFFL